MRRPLLASLTLLVALPAFGHELWFERQGKVLTLFHGHKHSGHAGVETLPYDATYVKEARCLGADGKTRILPAGRSPWTTEDNCAAVLAQVSSGYWTKTAWETKNLPRTGITGVVKSWLSEEAVKRIERWNDAASRPLGNGLEIVPLADPFALHPDDKLRVAVFADGKPLAGVPVAYGDDVRGSTGSDGSIAIRLRHGGVQLITTSEETPLADGKADSRIRTATLQFELPQ